MANGPRVFRVKAGETGISVTPEPDAYALEAQAAIQPLAANREAKRGSFWSRLFWGAASGLASLAIGVWAWNFVAGLLAAYPLLGMLAAALAGLALLALLVLLTREVLAISRLNRVARLQENAAKALQADDQAAAAAVLAGFLDFSRSVPAMAGGRAALDDLKGEIMDATDRLKLAERLIVAPQDRQVREAIAAAAKRVSVVTAISPRALVDILFVAAQAVRLVRLIAEAYGGKPSHFGALKLGRAVLSHLAITGGLAIGDSIVSQVFGAGLAARLSAKLGEGVLNGILTARIGLAAIAVCRPLPFVEEPAPSLSDVAGSLFSENREN